MGPSMFCSDIAFEILSRTSLKSLDRCKTVCKEWNELSYQSSFIPLHCERTKTISGCFLQNKKSNGYINKFATMGKSTQNISLDFLPRPIRNHMKIVTSSRRGILCFIREEHKKFRFYVCKPSTQQWWEMSNPKMRYETKKVAMVVTGSDPLRYKIVRLSKRPDGRLMDSNNFHCEIFNSETYKWKKHTDILLPNEVSFCNQSAVVIGGSVYWLLTNAEVLNFNVITKTSTLFSLPQALEEASYVSISTEQLVEYKGKLAFLLEEDYLMLWILEDSTNYIWGQKRTLNLQVVREKDRHASCIGFSNADIVVMAGCYSLIFYNFRTCSVWKFDLDSNWVTLQDFFVLWSDMEPIELSGRR